MLLILIILVLTYSILLAAGIGFTIKKGYDKNKKITA